MKFRIHLKNFQSIKEATLDIAPLTFLAGPNSAGKSAVADALEAISLNFGQQSESISFEKIENFRRDISEKMTYGIGGDFVFNESPFHYYKLENMGLEKSLLMGLGYDLSMGSYHKSIKSGDLLFHVVPVFKFTVPQMDIYINGEMAVSFGLASNSIIFYLSNSVIIDILEGLSIFRLLRNESLDERVFRDNKVLSISANFDFGRVNNFFGVKVFFNEKTSIVTEVLQYIINSLISAIKSKCWPFEVDDSCSDFDEGLIDPFVHIGPLRSIPEKDAIKIYRSMGGEFEKREVPSWNKGEYAWYNIAAGIAENNKMHACEVMGIKTVDNNCYDFSSGQVSINSYLVNNLSRLNETLCGKSLMLDYRLTGSVDLTLSLTGCELPFSPRAIANADYSATLRVIDGNGKIHLLSDVGVGISQVIPVLYAGLTQPFSIIEQPELHLHPKLQLELASFFIEQVEEGRMFILETHSENMFLRVLRTIRETNSLGVSNQRLKLHQDQVSVLYFEKTDSLYTNIHALRISEDGEFIDRWPEGFFAEREAELF